MLKFFNMYKNSLNLSLQSTCRAIFTNTWIRCIVIAAFLSLRIWPRVINPQVWDEDGTQILVGLINNGLTSIVEPVNGYLIVIPKIISTISFYTSIFYYPLISTLVCVAFIVYVLFSIAASPLLLRGGLIISLFTILIPSDPECFGAPLYTFWWSSLLLFLCLIWRDSEVGGYRRLVWIFFAGLSSPVIVSMLPLFWFRAYLYKKRPFELMMPLVATMVSIVQLLFMHASKNVVPGISHLTQYSSWFDIIPKFVGSYFYGNYVDWYVQGIQWIFGYGLLALVMFAFIRDRKKYLWIVLIYLLSSAIVMSIVRVDLVLLDPIKGGPRYFFYPFILISWMLLNLLLSFKNKLTIAVLLIAIIFSLVNFSAAVTRTHTDLMWDENLVTCEYFKMYRIPIQYNGDAAAAWGINLPGNTCKTLLQRDALISENAIYRAHHNGFPYKLDVKLNNVTVKSSDVVNNNWCGSDFEKTVIENMLVIGSIRNNDQDKGSISIKIKRGDRIMFKTGPVATRQYVYIEGEEDLFYSILPQSTEFKVLEFSNEKLPDNFVIKFVDDGDSWGEWSAIAILNK